jgi:citrate lyase subunit beta / citryl-CoA lyase
MNLRSWLFIPGDSDKKLAKADATGADALILDLEDSVALANKPSARQKVRAFLDERPADRRASQLWVRINPLDDAALIDLAAVVGGAPDGIMLPKIDGPTDVLRLSHQLEALEARDGVSAGHIRILPVATETPVAPLRLAEFASARLPRLIGLTWGAEDLSAAIGASTNLDEKGEWALTYRFARSSMLLAAKAAGVQAIDTLYVNFKDADGLRSSCRAAAREGFTGRIAIHPDQVAVINEAFAPSEEDVNFARRVVAAFEAQSGTGTVGLDGKMLDIPHLKQAQHVLAMHEQYRRKAS